MVAAANIPQKRPDAELGSPTSTDTCHLPRLPSGGGQGQAPPRCPSKTELTAQLRVAVSRPCPAVGSCRVRLGCGEPVT